MNNPMNECTGVAQVNCADTEKGAESPEDMAEMIRRLRYDLRRAERRAYYAEENLNRIIRTVKDATK